MRRAAARNRGLDEVVDRVTRGFLAVVRDNRRILVEITEVEPATTELPDVLFVGAFSDASTNRVALRTELLQVVGERTAQRLAREGRVHGIA
jgi:hypothetical protein